MVQAIEWPEVTLKSGRKLVFRLSYSAHYLLAKWGTSLTEASCLQISAACAGNFNEAGKWKSAFTSDMELADEMEPEDGEPVIAAGMEALKKALPGAQIQTVTPAPAAPETAA
jgi:hypothetical protein